MKLMIIDNGTYRVDTLRLMCCQAGGPNVRN
jgi:hypothetical protein